MTLNSLAPMVTTIMDRLDPNIIVSKPKFACDNQEQSPSTIPKSICENHKQSHVDSIETSNLQPIDIVKCIVKMTTAQTINEVF